MKWGNNVYFKFYYIKGLIKSSLDGFYISRVVILMFFL